MQENFFYATLIDIMNKFFLSFRFLTPFLSIIMRLTALLNVRYAPRDFKVYHSGLGKYTTGIQSKSLEM